MDREDVLLRQLEQLIAETRKRNEIEEQKRVELKRIRLSVQHIADTYMEASS